MTLMDEIRKIPLVTRFLSGSLLVASFSVMLGMVSFYDVMFVKELVITKFQIWRIYTSFFLEFKLRFVFALIMMYRTSEELELGHFVVRSADYVWQLVVAAFGILAMNIPLHSIVHTRPLVIALVYLHSCLAPPGRQTSLFGFINIPLVYLPYIMIALDLIVDGPYAAASSVTGAVVGHLWWWGVFHTRVLETYARAPTWLRSFIGNSDGPSSVGSRESGVHVIPPPRVREQGSPASGRIWGHQWGTGRRLED